MNLDLAIVNGTVVDGSGAAPFKADVGIVGDRIVMVGDLGGAPAARTLDAAGMMTMPGFIDAHGHSDVGLTVNPQCQSKLAQGITTEVMGNCGYSPFPLFANNRHYLLDPKGVDITWSSASEYFGKVAARGAGINTVPQVGHITVRAAVLDNQDRPATRDEIERMKGHVRDAMEQGARGLSTGLDYPCAITADLDEIVALAKVVAEYDGFYSSHLRGYSRNVLNAVVEAIEVGRRTGVRVQLSHLGVFGRKQWGFGRRLLDIMDQARAEGVRVACDIMPYRTKGSWWAPRAILPAEVHDWKRPWTENLPGLKILLADPARRAALKIQIEDRRVRPKYGFHEEFVQFSDWRDIYIEELAPDSPHRAFIGQSVADLAEGLKQHPCDVWFDLVLTEGETLATTCIQVSEDDFMGLMTDPWTMFGTDAIATDLALLREPWNTIQPHPRHYGSFPRVLGKFVREDHAVDLPTAVRRMTGLVADFFALEGRGYVRADHQADLVVVNPETVGERATWRLPNAYPEGVEHVFVNGTEAVAKGRCTGALGGRMLTRTG
jgi:N-acyl-D-amino-acid deacylase